MPQNDKRFSVVISTIAKFHSFELALQLQKTGCLSKIFTGYPHFKLRDTGVIRKRIHSFPWLQTPYMILGRSQFFRRHLEREWSWWSHETLDRHVAKNLPNCSIVSILSGSGLHTGRVAKSRGIAYVCDRGSSHISYQNEILSEEHERFGIPYTPIDPRRIDKENEEYDLADAITVPSKFSYRSFISLGVPENKVHLVPYGVNLDFFKPSAPKADKFRVLFVGQHSLRKGLLDLFEAFKKAAIPGARLVLVGGHTWETEILLKRVSLENVELKGSLSWKDVAIEMSRASVMVLPSIEEGLAIVQGQALACGCPVIATAHTGAEDLFSDGSEGFIIPIRSPSKIAEKLVALYEDRELLERMSAAALVRVRDIRGWDKYGESSLDVFKRIASSNKAPTQVPIIQSRLTEEAL